MNYTLLSLDQTPPLSVPLRFFLTAPLFAVAAIAVLLFEPQSFASRWSQPMLAATHFITLGFAAMIMFGAVQQLLPVLLGVKTPRARGMSRLLHLLLSTGTAALGIGFIRLWPGLQFLAMLLLVPAIFIVLFLVIRAVRRTTSRHHSVEGMGLAAIALAMTAALGVYLLSGYILTSLAVARDFTELHQLWGLLGWILALVIAVAYQVVPMFQITPEYPKRLSRWLIRVLALGLIVWTLSLLLLGKDVLASKTLMGLAALILAIVIIAFVGATLLIQARRRRRLPDVTLNFWRVGMLSLLGAVMVWLLSWLKPSLFVDRDVLLGVLFLVGFVMSVINGMTYKIVPFLVWLHLNNWTQAHALWQGRIPNMKQIISERRARGHYYLHVTGLVLLAAASWQTSWLLYVALFFLLASNLTLMANIVSASKLYQHYADEVVKASSSSEAI